MQWIEIKAFTRTATESGNHVSKKNMDALFWQEAHIEHVHQGDKVHPGATKVHVYPDNKGTLNQVSIQDYCLSTILIENPVSI